MQWQTNLLAEIRDDSRRTLEIVEDIKSAMPTTIEEDLKDIIDLLEEGVPVYTKEDWFVNVNTTEGYGVYVYNSGDDQDQLVVDVDQVQSEVTIVAGERLWVDASW